LSEANTQEKKICKMSALNDLVMATIYQEKLNNINISKTDY